MTIKQRGFTLFELMIVIAIMGFAMAVVVPRLGGALERAEIRACLRDTSDLLRTAHAQAIIKRENWRIRIDMGDGVLSLVGPQAVSLSGEEKESETPAKTLSLPKKLKITDFEIGKQLKKTKKSSSKKKDADNEVIFYPFGNSSGCKILFRDDFDQEYTIEVNPFTSRVKIINEASKNS